MNKTTCSKQEKDIKEKIVCKTKFKPVESKSDFSGQEKNIKEKITRKTKFKPVNHKLDFPELEKDILEWWHKNNIVQKYLSKNNHSDKIFSFIDGPITANGPMGVHHARGRTLKDVFQRYKNLQGFKQRFQNGFDCQGLWVEVEVEKSQGFNSKKDIQEFGLANFTNACIARVNKFANIQTEQSKRLGMFMDWDNSYYTMSETNNLYIWHFLKKLHQKGWLYKQKSASTWCPRCETGLSQHEQADGYKDIQDTSLYVKFKLSDTTNHYILAWTTTPWTLLANVLLAINTKHQYVKVQDKNHTLYLAKLAADRLGFKHQQTIDAKTLLDRQYDSLFSIPAQKNIKHKIVDWELVDPQEGTGVVHVAPGCGQEDFDLGKKLKADIIAPLNQTGHFQSGYGSLSDQYAHHVKQKVIDYLEQRNVLFKTDIIKHRYPHCWRCGTKCLFRLENNWFIDCQQIRPLLKKQTDQSNWLPKYVRKRMHNWLDNMDDWMISRKRFYGLALPFYQSTGGDLIVIGSKQELKQLAVNPAKVDQLPSLHRPWIDDIKIKDPKTGEILTRVTDVGDCWLDAGVVPFSTLKYLEDKKYWQTWFPAELVCEMIEQVRLWFYSMLFYGVVFENKIPYKNTLTYYEVRDEKGNRMSKTKGNGIPFDQAVEKMSADAMRWLYCKQKSHMIVNFGYSTVSLVKRNFISMLWNSYKYFVSSAGLSSNTKQSNSNILDTWLISKLNHTIKLTTKYLDKYDTSQATEDIENLVHDLSTWYIRRSRGRSDNHDLLQQTLQTISILISPFMPYISEEIYQNLSRNHYQNKKSVHLQNWPKYNQKNIDIDLEKDMDLVRQICQLIHGQRQKHQIKTRQPLNQVTVTTAQTRLSNQLMQIIKDETNIKQINWTQAKQSPQPIAILDTKITPELKQEGQFRDLSRQVQILRKEADLHPLDQIKIYAPDWPKQFEKELLHKTKAVSVEKSDQLSITKI